MNPKNHILMDKLKGHTYRMSPWQYLEVMEHYDAEMSYIVQHSIENFREENAKKAVGQKGKFYPYELFKVVGKAILDTILEREGTKISYSKDIHLRVADKMFKGYTEYIEHGGTLDKGEVALAEAFIIYGINDALIQARYLRK